MTVGFLGSVVFTPSLTVFLPPWRPPEDLPGRARVSRAIPTSPGSAVVRVCGGPALRTWCFRRNRPTSEALG